VLLVPDICGLERLPKVIGVGLMGSAASFHGHKLWRWPYKAA
jgi:hypothetical protein